VVDIDDLFVRLVVSLGAGAGADPRAPLPSRLCTSAAQLLGCDGGAITMAYTRVERVTLCTTDDPARVLEEAQDVTGQGPGPDAFSTGSYSRLDLGDTGGQDPRWPLLASGTLAALAPVVVHALPMVHGTHVLGVLTLYQRGHHGRVDLDAAVVVTQMVGAALLADGPSQHELGQGPWAERAEVHQATGMVVAQLHIPERDALALLRAHAYSHGHSVADSAHAVITRRLVFSSTPGAGIEST
jgi:hypothetical protein